MSWWLGIVTGLGLLAAELLIPTGFFLLLIGIGAITTGLVVLAGFAAGLSVQCMLCALVSLLLLAGVRERLTGKHIFGRGQDGLAGAEVILSETIPPGKIGKGELRGASWSIKNTGTAILNAGDRVVVDSVQNLVLLVSGLKNQQ